MKISLFPHIKENKPIIFDGNGQELAKGLLNPCVPFGAVSKNDIPLWSPTIFNGKRSSSNAQYITMLVFDIDDGLTPFDSWRLFSDWAVLAHTSFSHKPNFHKYRIILPLANPVPAKEWNRASKWAFQFWADIVGRGEPDQKALKDCARIYFRYAIPFNDSLDMDDPCYPGNYFQAVASLNNPLLELDWASIPKEEPKPEKKHFHRTKPVSLESIQLDSRYRERFGVQVGGKMVGNTVRYIPCPQCKDNSVYFSIDLGMPNTIKYPQCNHKNSCGWWGTLKDLL